MSEYLDFKIVRGAEDSANDEALTFDILSAGIEGSYLFLNCRFHYPLLISTGSKKDIMKATVVDGSFFMPSNSNGPSIRPGTSFY